MHIHTLFAAAATATATPASRCIAAAVTVSRRALCSASSIATPRHRCRHHHRCHWQEGHQVPPALQSAHSGRRVPFRHPHKPRPRRRRRGSLVNGQRVHVRHRHSATAAAATTTTTSRPRREILKRLHGALERRPRSVRLHRSQRGGGQRGRLIRAAQQVVQQAVVIGWRSRQPSLVVLLYLGKE